MLDVSTLRQAIPDTLTALSFSWPYDRESGKVRESFSLPGGRRLLVTTDRLSAFDRVLAAVPYKGQVLNQLSDFWFRETSGIVTNHLLEVPDPNVSLVQDCAPLPVEVIVRGCITGVTKTSLWTLYAAGERHIYGYEFPDGLRKNDVLPEPLITPTTKAGPGGHDECLTCAEVVERGFVDRATWDRVATAALAIFRRGQEVARQAGFLLVDTKYEFGRISDGTLMLIDEVHTPDSSRFWTVSDWEQSVGVALRGRPVREIEPWDKEYARLWYAAQGFRGDGVPPALPEDRVVELARRYVALYEGLTGETFEPAPPPAGPRIARVLRSYLGTGG
jgi:phosphoribosylaminoimidazole-succinocarboxamide synthase